MLEHTLVFIDDHPLYRDGLIRCVGERLPGVRLHGEDALAPALSWMQHHDVDLALVDFHLAQADGVLAVQRIREQYPTVACAILSGDISAQLSWRARQAGVVALLSKLRSAEQLADALQAILRGECIFDDQENLLPQEPGLTDRRLEILRLAALGQSNKEIARTLTVSERTIKDHWSHILLRLNVANRTQAVGSALQLGLIQLSD